MQLRSGRRLPPRAPARGGQRRHGRTSHCRVDGGGDDDDVEEDRISSLPDDLILAVLVRLRCLKAAARTSVLARRWRGLWTQLPELHMFDLTSLEAALAQVTRPALDYLCIDLLLDGEALGRVSSVLCDVAERLAAKVVTIDLLSDDEVQGVDRLHLPCFRTSTHLCLTVNVPDNYALMMPPPGSKFEALTTLVLDRWVISFGDLIPMCPSLRYLNIADLMFGEVTVYSTSLEKLKVNTHEDEDDLWLIDISAPLLKEASFDIRALRDLSVWFSVPMVEKIFWTCEFIDEDHTVGLPCMRLDSLDYTLRHGVRQLCLHIVYLNYLSEEADWTFVEDISQKLPLFSPLSVLKLELEIEGHAFAPLVLHLLHQIQPSKALNVKLTRARKAGMQCPSNCPCEQPNNNWRTENISLTNLEEVTLDGFEGHDDEVDFLKVLFKCATVLKSMAVEVSNEGYEKICSIICEQCPDVECDVYKA